MLMKIENSCVQFQSKIKLITANEFKQKTSNLNPKRHEVGWPWTADTMKRGKNLFTTGIMDCITVGVVDGSNFVLAHLGIYNQAKAKAKHQKGFSIENVKRRLLKNFNVNNENLHGIILGGFQLRADDKYNINKLNKIRRIFEERQIPYTIFGARKDVHYFGKYSLFYSNKEDTIYISNTLAGKSSPDGKNLEIDVKENSVEYNTYEKSCDKYGPLYKRIRKETDTKGFFESQFRIVSVSNNDELI